MYREVIALAKRVGYYSAGTVEFMMNKDKKYYFLEMNTRLQVEHPVTELITGIDIVEQMIRVAAAEKLSFSQEDIKLKGWALESRIYAEDPSRGFLPSSGRILEYQEPLKSANIRVDSGVSVGGELRVESSQGNVSIASQIANKFVSNSPDIVVGVATIAAQSFSKYAKQSGTKLIFSSVTDPVQAGLVNDLNNPGNNTSGVSNFIPIEPQIAMFKKVKPSIKKLGFLYNPGEFNSISLIEKLKTVCPNFGIDLITMPAAKTSEVPGAAIKLSTTVDAIFISNDSTALSAMQTIIKAANEQNIPVFVSDIDIAQKGAIAALGPNQYKLGMQTARMIVRILNGENIDNQKVEFPTKIELLLNLKAAKKLDIEIDKTLISEANQFIK